MHINEQTPAILKRSLRKYFQYVQVWVTSFPDLSGSLGRVCTLDEFARATSIFAVASHREVSVERIISLLTQQKLDTRLLDVDVTCDDTSMTLEKSMRTSIKIQIHNKSHERFVSLPPYPVNLSYHWARPNGDIIAFDMERTPLLIPLMPDERRSIDMILRAPETEGKYLLQVSLVQEHHLWFEQVIKHLPLTIPVSVV